MEQEISDAMVPESFDTIEELRARIVALEETVTTQGDALLQVGENFKIALENFQGIAETFKAIAAYKDELEEKLSRMTSLSYDIAKGLHLQQGEIDRIKNRLGGYETNRG